MKPGICVCGLNGSGKTTLAYALAKELSVPHMDVEQYYFTSGDNPYSTARSREEVEVLLLQDIKQTSGFVFSAVNGNMTPEINACYTLIIYLDVPLDIRIQRIRQRAQDRFGDRVLFGGDMYEQEERFFAYAEKRSAAPIEDWLKTQPEKVIYLDGTKPILENVQVIISLLQWEKGDRAAVDKA